MSIMLEILSGKHSRKAQLVEHATDNRVAAGSNPAPATIERLQYGMVNSFCISGNNCLYYHHYHSSNSL